MYPTKIFYSLLLLSLCACNGVNSETLDNPVNSAQQAPGATLANVSASNKQAVRAIPSDAAPALNPANIASVIPLRTIRADDSRIQVNVVVEELGSSADISPRHKVYFTLYRTGEMFTTHAAFTVGSYFSWVSAKAISDTKFLLTVTDLNLEQGTYVVDATQAIEAIEQVTCGSAMDCKAAANFTTTIAVSKAAQ